MKWQTVGVRVPRSGVGMMLICAALGAAAVPTLSGGSESQGSIPAEVAAYATNPDGLIARLNDLFGLTLGGDGIVFDATTEVGELKRVFTWTSDFLAGKETDTPAERQNLWITTVVVNAEPVGVATIWINPTNVKPELAEFSLDLEFSNATAEVAKDAYLIHDVDRQAWFTLIGQDLVPIVSGNSGLSGPTTLSVYQRLIVARANAEPSADGQANSPITPTIIFGTAVVALVGVAAFLLVVRARNRRKLAAVAAVVAEPIPADAADAADSQEAETAKSAPRSKSTPLD